MPPEALVKPCWLTPFPDTGKKVRRSSHKKCSKASQECVVANLTLWSIMHRLLGDFAAAKSSDYAVSVVHWSGFRPSVCSIHFLTLIWRVAHTKRDSTRDSMRRGQRTCTFPSDNKKGRHTSFYAILAETNILRRSTQTD